MLNKNKLLDNKEFIDLILESIYIYKFNENKYTVEETNKRKIQIKKIEEMLMKNKFINKDSTIENVSIYKLSNKVQISIQEVINYKRYNTIIYIESEKLQGWLTK